MRSLIFLLAIFAGPWATAQQGFQEGFLLTHDLDTLRGLVRFNGKASVPGPCQYKPSKKDVAQEIYPSTIHGFCTHKGAYFYSRSIGKSDDVFLEVLVKGYVNLFKFGDIFFIEKADSAFFELSDELEADIIGEQVQQRSKNYTRMLALLMSDCPEASLKIQTLPLKEKPLVRLVRTYNRCKGSASELFRVKGKT